MRRHTPALLAMLTFLSSTSARAWTIDGYDAKSIRGALSGRKIVVPAGCAEEPRLEPANADAFRQHFPDLDGSSPAFRTRVSKAFREGLAKAARGRVELDTAACASGAASTLVQDAQGHGASIDGSRVESGKAYFAYNGLLFDPPAGADSSRCPQLRLDFGIYDPQEHHLVYYASRNACFDDFRSRMPGSDPAARNQAQWEKVARHLGERIGAALATMPGR